MAKDFLIATAKNVTDQTKAQKTFYTYLKKIDKLKNEVEDARNAISYFGQKRGEILIPAEQELAAVKSEWVKALYRWRSNPAISHDLVQVATQAIVTEGYELINVFNHNDLIEIYDECAEVDFETEKKDEETAKKEELREMFAEMGINIEDDITEENIYEHLANAQEKIKAEQEQAEAERAERGAKKKKTAKQQAAEQQRAAQKLIETKSVREIYMKLAKEFHPDTEPDEKERTRKTEVMQRITAAYESNDLPELLRLQLEYEQISIDKLDSLADAQLTAYNNVFKEQIKQLEQEKQNCAMQLAIQNPELPPYIRLQSTPQVDSFIKTELRKLQLQKKQTESDLVQLLGTPTVAKKYLKRLKKELEQVDMFGGMEDMLKMMFGF